MPFGAGAGLASTRVFFDPDQNGLPPFAARDTISLFGNGVVQLVAEEMTEKLIASKETAAQQAKATPGTPASQPLTVNGVDFGTITATASPTGDVKYDVTKVRGVSPDLVIRPFAWKGSITTLRNFSVAAASFGMGMQAEEFVWRLPPKAGDDPDGDGVKRELSVGDITAMAIYNAAQEVPTDLGHVAAMGVTTAPDATAKGMIDHGRQLFTQVGCATCHVPEMHLGNTVFEEPTRRGAGQYLDAFLAGKTPDYDPARPVRFDLLKDSQAPRLEADPKGGAVVRLYGDLKRHDMGRQLAEAAPVAVLHVTLAPLQYDGKTVMISRERVPDARALGRRQHRTLPARRPRRHPRRGDHAARRGRSSGTRPAGAERGAGGAGRIRQAVGRRSAGARRLPEEPRELFERGTLS